MMDEVPTEVEFDEMERAILRRSRLADRQRRRRNVGIVASVAVAGVIAGTGAIMLATTEMQRYVTYCYAAADLDSHFTQIGTPMEVRDRDGRALTPAIGDAVEKCAAVWRIGFFQNDGAPTDDGRTYDVPDLQLCMRADGVAAVLPRDGFTGSDSAFCEDLGLALP